MGIFDFLNRKGVNKDILRVEERKKQSEEIKKQHEERNIEIELEKLAQEAELRKVNAVKEKTEKELEKYLMSFDTNILCEDGVERKYSGNMYGILEEVIVESLPIIRIMSNDNLFNFKTIKSKNDIPRYFYNFGRIYNFKRFWFSKQGKYLSVEEVLKSGKIQSDEHNYYLSNNNNYKNYFESIRAESNKKREKMNIKKSLGLPNPIVVINNINNIYYINQQDRRPGNDIYTYGGVFKEDDLFYKYESLPIVGSLFDGTIDDVKYKNGITDSLSKN